MCDVQTEAALSELIGQGPALLHPELETTLVSTTLDLAAYRQLAELQEWWKACIKAGDEVCLHPFLSS